MLPQPPLSKVQYDFVHQLTQHKVQFIVIGGKAVQANGVLHRETRDLDILLGPSPENIDRFAGMLKKFGVAPPVGHPHWASALGSPNRLFQYPDQQRKEIDILTSIDGIDFHGCLQRSVAVPFHEQEMQVACRDDMVRMKGISAQSGNDPIAIEKDIADIESLLKIPPLHLPI